MTVRRWLFFSFLIGFTALADARRQPDTYKVIHVYPHDRTAFTQGLLFVDGHLYESTGQNGRSSVRMVDLQTGQVLQKRDLDPQDFGEGLTDWAGNLIQLTWTQHKGYVYDGFSLSIVHTFEFKGEGWGLTHDASHLILSDGSSDLRLLDPKSFRQVGKIRVTEDGSPVEQLNELEYVRGEIYANIWHSDEIVRISPHTGKVLGRIDLRGLLDKREVRDPEAVLNGIAYDAATGRLFVTGKLWPKLFEIKIANRQ